MALQEYLEVKFKVTVLLLLTLKHLTSDRSLLFSTKNKIINEFYWCALWILYIMIIVNNFYTKSVTIQNTIMPYYLDLFEELDFNKVIYINLRADKAYVWNII